MSIAESINSMFVQYGNEVKIENQNDKVQNVKAFIQPLRYKNKMYIDGNFLSGGYMDGGHFLYIGPPEVRIDKIIKTAVITSNEEKFVAKRAELYIVSDTPIYIWAVLTPYAEE